MEATSSGGVRTILNVVGTRPNFMKIAPLMRAFQARPEVRPVLVHTGQHYDERMSRLFFEQLEIPRPDVNLEVGSASHAAQTAEIMKRFEPVVEQYRPDLVLVVGDVNSTIACALVAAKRQVAVAHVEAGLRSFDRTMPEEINRLLTDAISDFLFVTEPSGLENLRREGIPDEKVFFVGNVMIDTLLANLEKARRTAVLEDLCLQARGYAVMTLHRPSNVDDPQTFGRILGAVRTIAEDMPVVFPIHPRTRKNMARLGLDEGGPGGLHLVEPLGYLEFLRLMAEARLVLTDSGGIQEEATILKVPCLTLRENTERPVTVDVGCNQIVGTDPNRILAAYRKVVAVENFTCGTPDKWDGRAAERIADTLVSSLADIGSGRPGGRA
ncbi:MAG: UDP-N-acetylglucosamine 2-epimerase (non-hydrolyzing) [Planctomycetota bacterium]|nr:UDP-N-acetylglucosamine 2-epimerase (non-hydrolyzing) [Planctomycetota bacterium]